jgi:hypothetical protein
VKILDRLGPRPEIMRLTRRIAGVLLKDWPRYRRALAAAGDDYLALCNRGESLRASPEGKGFECAWRWTSDLHATKYLRGLGASLMRRALADHVVRWQPAPRPGAPRASFVIGHRGSRRSLLLLKTLESIAGQTTAVECIVVEQDTRPRVRDALPPWVRYVHLQTTSEQEPYNRAAALNAGAAVARSPLLVLHDNDVVVPADYAERALAHVADGYDVVNLKRFIFYLGPADTESLVEGAAALDTARPDSIMQNALGGGTVAITAAGFARIGGMDDAFSGWGGEDNEFWERACTLHVWRWAYLPFVHLWHEPQAGKYANDTAAAHRSRQLTHIPAAQRIEALRSLHAAGSGGPR